MLFDWDDANREHIARHAVKPSEAEEALSGVTLELDFDMVEGEQRFSQVGQTRSGRILRVAVTMRGALVRVVTAHDVNRNLQSAYLDYARGFHE